MKKKILSLFMVIAITIFQFAPTMVTALSYDLNDGDIINSYNITSDVVTLYVGNISVDGASTLKYLYTDKSVNTETLTEMRKILTSDYASLLPTTAGQVKVSNDNTVTVNDVFTDAGLVAANKYTGTVTDTSSTILYNQTQFNSLVTASQTEVSDEATAEVNNLNAYNTRKATWESKEQEKADDDPNYTPVAFPETYKPAFNDSTSYPTSDYFISDIKTDAEPLTTYIVYNGVATSVNTYNINRTIIKVVNTSANVSTTKYTVTFKDGDTTLSTKEVSEGQKVTPPSDPTKTDYEFMYWSNANGVNINDNITADTIFTANWIRKFNITSGADQTFYLESDKDIVIVSNGPLNELTGFGIFGDNHPAIGMADLTEGTDYVLENGSTKLTLKNSFLKTLGTDTYYVDFYYQNNNTYGTGYTDTTLLVKAGTEPASSTDTTTTGTTTNDSSNPQTGDNIMFYISMLGLSVIGLAGTGFYVRKKRYN